MYSLEGVLPAAVREAEGGPRRGVAGPVAGESGFGEVLHQVRVRRRVRERGEQVEPQPVDFLEELFAAVLAVGQHQGPGAAGGQDRGDHAEQGWDGLGDRAGGAGEAAAEGQFGIGVEHEQRLGGLRRLPPGVLPVAPGLSFGVADHVVRIHRQQAPEVLAADAADASQRQLQILGVLHRVRGQQFVDGLVAGHEGKAVGYLEPLLAYGDAIPQEGPERRLVDQMQRQARGKVVGARAGAPAAQQIPRPQTEQLRHEQPDADHVAGHLVGEQLPHGPLDVLRRAGLGAQRAPRAPRLDGTGGVQCRIQGVEPLFWSPYSVITRSTLRVEIATPSCLSFWATTAALASGSRKR